MKTIPFRGRAGRATPRIAATLLLVALFGMTPKTALADFEGGAAPCTSRPALPEGRPRIGLALGGGGARGVAHISVLRKLEEMQVPIDCIAGTSMGALVGAMYASGMSVDEIERTVLTLDWSSMFDDSLPRPERSYRRKRDDELVIAAPGIGIDAKGVKVAAGLLAGERILLLFEKMVEPVATIEDFDRLPIPYRAVAADINTGEPLVIEGGDLALAMRASMSIPGAFPPVQVGEHVVVDGGVARNIPIDVVRNMGADIIIAVDVGTPLATISTQSNLLSLTGQVIGLLTVRNTREQIATLTERDILISPPLGDKVETGDFEKGVEALAIGKEGVEAVVPQLARLSASPEAYVQNVSVRTGRQTSPPVVQFVRVNNQTRYRDELVLARVDIPLDQPLDSERLEKRLFQLFGMETLSQATYEVVEEDGRTGVILHVREKVQGPNYVEAGMSMSGDFDGRFDFGLRLGVRQSPINESGGELRYLLRMGDDSGFLAEYYQPFGDLGRYFFATRAEYDNRQFNFFDDQGNNTAEYDVSQAGIQFGVGREFGTVGAVTFGLRRLTGEAEVQIGDPSLPDFDVDTGEVFLEGAIDRLDSFYFPRDGYLGRTRYTFSRDGLGADTNFEQLDIDGIFARTFGKHSGQFGVRYHVTTSGVAPIQSLYRLGGFSRLVGFQPNELTGQHYAVLLGGYSYEIGDVFNQPALVGVQLEYGNAWQQRSDMLEDGILNGSVYIGLDSWLGPILFGIGARESNHYNLFLEVGHRF